MENIKLAVIGLGYVGLPLARLFATRYPVVGYDVKRERVAALMEGRDATQEVSGELLKSVLLPRLPEEGETGLFCIVRCGTAPWVQLLYCGGPYAGRLAS